MKNRIAPSRRRDNEVSARIVGDELIVNGKQCCVLTMCANVLLMIGKDANQLWLVEMAGEINDRVNGHGHDH